MNPSGGFGRQPNVPDLFMEKCSFRAGCAVAYD